jgi:hypothetical protein
MAKSAGRTTTEDEGARLSVEDADRAAAAFVPLWQFDEAPFAASPKLADAELHALSVPAAAAAVLVPTPAFGASASAPTVSAASTEQELLESRSTVKMTPVHIPNAPRPTEPELPSVMLVESATPAPVAPGDPLRDKVTVSVRTVSPVKPDASPESQREPKTDPALSRARPARRPMAEPDDVGAGYNLPRSRTPLLVGVGVLGSALLIVIVYAISSAMSGPPAAASSTSTASAMHTETPPRPAEPGVGIPPPPAVDDTTAAAPPPAAAPAPTPPPPVVAAPPPPPPVPVVNVASLPPAPPPHAVHEPPPPVAHTIHTAPPPARPRPPRKSTPTPASGGIVRDNPF